MKRTMIGLLLAAATLTACDSYNDERGKGDAPIGSRDEQPRTVVFNADGFPNLSVICDGTTGIYTNTRDAGTMVEVEDSEHCR